MTIKQTMKALLCAQHFLHQKSMGKFWRSRARNAEANSLIWPEMNSPVLVTCKLEEDLIENEGVNVSTTFPQYKSMGAFGCYENQRFDPICPKAVCSLSPTPMMLHMKFEQDWPSGRSDIYLFLLRFYGPVNS